MYLVMLAGFVSASTTVPLKIQETEGVSRTGHPVTSGIPFPEGTFTDIDNVRLLDHQGQEIPLQKEVTATWDKEGSSIKWLLLDFQADISGNSDAQYNLEYGNDVNSQTFSPGISVIEDSARIEVDTGNFQFYIRKDYFNFIDEAILDGVEIISPGNNQGLSIIDQDGVEYNSVNDAENYVVEIEDKGPLRAQIKCSGVYESVTGDERFMWIVRFNAYAGKPIVRVYHTIIFSEDMFAYALADISIRTPLNLDNNLEYAIGGNPDIISGALDNDIHLLQDDWDHYSAKKKDGTIIGEGDFSKGWIDLGDGQKGLSLYLRDMWQNYPLELEAEGNSVIAHLWPLHGDYTEQVQIKKQMIKDGKIKHFFPYHEGNLLNLTAVGPTSTDFYLSPHNAIGISKTHELVYYFHDNDYQSAQSEKNLKAYGKELMAVNNNWLCESGVFRNMHPYDPVNFPEVEALFESMFDQMLYARNKFVDYGMVNYGDVHDNGADSSAGGRYWLNYRIDWINSIWILYLRSGDPKYLDYAISSSRHVMDIDTCQIEAVFTDIQGHDVNRIIGGYHTGAAAEMGVPHWGNEPRPPGSIDQGQENIFNYYYLTGYKRAKDVLENQFSQNALKRYEHILSDGTIDWWSGRGIHAWTLFIKLYELTWDDRFLELSNAGFNTVKKLQAPNGMQKVNAAIGWTLFHNSWLGEGHHNYLIFNDDPEVLDVVTRYARSAGAMGISDDTLGVRLHSPLLNLYSYGYELTGDDDFVSFGKHYLDYYLYSKEDIFFRYGETTIPDIYTYSWFIMRLPYFLDILSDYDKEIKPPLYPPSFIVLENNREAVFLTSEENDQEIDLVFAIETDTKEFEAWQTSGNIILKIYDPNGEIIHEETFTVENHFDFQEGDTVFDDPRIKQITIPQDSVEGTYKITFAVDKDDHRIALLSNNLDKTMIEMPDDGIFLDRGRYYFYVPEDISEFTLINYYQPEGMTYKVWYRMVLVDPDGETYDAGRIIPSEDKRGRMWSVVISTRIDTHIDLSGLPSPLYLSLSPQSHFDYVYSGSICPSGADISPQDNSVSINELIAFIDKWKSGHVTINLVIRAIAEWKSGC